MFVKRNLEISKAPNELKEREQINVGKPTFMEKKIYTEKT